MDGGGAPALGAGAPVGPGELGRITRVVLIVCGTSWHAALVGTYLLEAVSRTPVEVDVGSEFRYRQLVVDTMTLVLAISQSGETADTLAAGREAKSRGSKLVAIWWRLPRAGACTRRSSATRNLAKSVTAE